MSIRMLAIDLYRANQKVNNLQQRLSSCKESERAKINQELLEAGRELQLLRRMMDGEKETGASRNKYVTRNKFR